ncbi:beta-galactosidase [Lactiplantibacillus pentosus]|uniref:beta-galactosidase n=1 Tax=Lactiplantibacillus pentosus TaxID=1589 RepID=UPI001C1FD8B9|nr:beta-galactosidase [Lactiplantibacillus pentosus]MBU7501980.1 beta-galactosidase [Lactiplantibacillus pentosus]MDY1543656.1 beta-galactosidase [Lactiplantibacillus pentosus]
MLTIYLVNEHDEIQLNYSDLSEDLAHKTSSSTKSVIKFISTAETDLTTFDFGKDDIVCLGFGHHFDLNYVQHTMPQLVKILKARNTQIVLVTELRYFHENETYFDKSADELAIHQLAYDQRLKVLDLYSYLNAWYQQLSASKRSEKLERVKNASDLYQIKKSILKQLLSCYLTSWFSRKFFVRTKIKIRGYGASLYPEVWDKLTNQTDIAEMHKIGMNTVRIGEFFWDKLEPQEDHYNMEYLVNLLSQLKEHGLQVILGIPSPTPPRWFTLHYPESRIVNLRGETEEHGSRQHVCTNNLNYRRKAYQLARKIARVANDFDNIIAIQIDNEFKCHVDQCFCESCQRLWPQWLKEKYQTIERLNTVWGTNLWSERYPDFQSVVMPTKTPFTHNSGLVNAFRTFTADTLNDFAAGLAQTLIAETNIPITHNTSLNFNLMNYELFNQLDLVGFDTYPMYDQYWNFPINLDLWRNLKDTDEVLLLETGASHVGYIGNYVTPHPKGFLQTEVFLGLAAGLKSFLFWPYRAQPAGVEQTHGAIVTQTGTPDLGYDDVLAGQKLVQKFKQKLDNTVVKKSKIALVYSDNAKREMHVETGGIYEYRNTITQFYKALVSRGVSVELIPDNVDFQNFNCVLIPYIRDVNSQLLARMKSFISAGGQLVVGPLTGDRTVEMTWIRGHNGLGELGQWLGIKNVVQYLSEEKRTRAKVKVDQSIDEFGGLVTMFNTDNTMKHVETIHTVAADRSIIYQRGNLTYLGGMPKDSLNSPLWDKLVDEIIKPCDEDCTYIEINWGIFKYRRESKDEIQFYLANMSVDRVEYELHQAGYGEDDDVINSGKHSLNGFECKLIRIKKVR